MKRRIARKIITRFGAGDFRWRVSTIERAIREHPSVEPKAIIDAMRNMQAMRPSDDWEDDVPGMILCNVLEMVVCDSGPFADLLREGEVAT